MVRLLFQTVDVTCLVLLALSFVYMFGLLFAGIHEMHRTGSSLPTPARTHVYEGAGPGTGGERRPGAGTAVYFLIPALNEALVIADTIRRLVSEVPSARIVVVDDASSDRTAEVSMSAAPENVILVPRHLPDARKGKGPALNTGLEAVRADVRRRGLDPGDVIVVVMDADGRLSVGACQVVADQFEADPTLGGVQLAVRIRNRHRVLTRLQDFDFWGMSALFQLGRNRLGTVALGGNGQFSRLSALDSIGDAPWSGSLTEDLDLGIAMRLAGWTMLTTSEASVDQEGVENLRRLLRQRTRWLQGHMLAGRRIPQIWNSEQLSTAGCIEMCLMLIVPWLFVLVWSVVIHLLYADFVYKLVVSGPSLYGRSEASEVVYGVSLYLLSFAPNLIIGFVYHRRDPELGLLRGLVYGHLMIANQYLYYWAGWRAFGRIIAGRSDWVKTERHGALQPTADNARVVGTPISV